MKRTLKQWLDSESYNLIRLFYRGSRLIARVDYIPSGWFAPQNVFVSGDVAVTEQELRIYRRHRSI